jgi:hypothetical protein
MILLEVGFFSRFAFEVHGAVELLHSTEETNAQERTHDDDGTMATKLAAIKQPFL